MTSELLNEQILSRLLPQTEMRRLAEKIMDGGRITVPEGLSLFHEFPLGILSLLAEHISRKLHENSVFYIRNFHIEPTNICRYHCRFCSYSQHANDGGAWELSMDQIREAVNRADTAAREVHITGGAHPDKNIADYGNILKAIREARPGIHIKAYSAVEIHHLHEKSGMPYHEILQYLKECGLDSLPGGGAEIFDETIRSRICPEKANADAWLSIHKTAHRLGIPSNATMLYGHIETTENRLNHMQQIRKLQDLTGGFQAFIPLKFRSANNKMSNTGEASLPEDLRTYAVSRIFFDNIPHLKAYWPMLGKTNAQLSLFFGVDDLDGTIQDSTQIYSLAGVSDKQSLTAEDMEELIGKAGKVAVERDALYNTLHS